MLLRPQDAPAELKAYLTTVGGKISFALTNPDDTPIPKTDDGKIIVTAGMEYKLSLAIQADKGIAPGEYTYKLPDGLTVNAGQGDFVIDGVNVGTWSIDTNGLITGRTA